MTQHKIAFDKTGRTLQSLYTTEIIPNISKIVSNSTKIYHTCDIASPSTDNLYREKETNRCVALQPIKRIKSKEIQDKRYKNTGILMKLSCLMCSGTKRLCA